MPIHLQFHPRHHLHLPTTVISSTTSTVTSCPNPALDVFQSDSLQVLATDSKADSSALELDNAPVHLADVSEGSREWNKDPLVDGEASENLALPPPRPDEGVVRSIEVLCQFIAKVGPDFENIARSKEAGNPHFTFLFGGEPGSAAAIGHEYFQWVKKKYLAVMESPKGLKPKVLPISTLTADDSSQSGNLDCVDGVHSPATSDMEMEDDITLADIGKGISNTNEESAVSTHEGSYASENVEKQIHAMIPVASGASSPTLSLMDAEDEKESSVFEDVSPERGSPDIAGLDDRTHASSRFPTEDSIEGKVLLNTEDVKSQETSGMFLKYGSPFRLIQDYASDESDENVRSDNDEDFNPISPSLAPTTGTSSLQQDRLSELCSNFGGQGSAAVAIESVDNTTLCELLPSIPQGAGRSPDKSSPSNSISHFDTMSKTIDPDNHPVENLSNDGRETSRPSPEYDALEGRKMDADQETLEFHSKESLMEKQASHDVDEFGRLIRKGVSGSDSDESQYSKKHIKRGRSRSRSLSRSPQGGRRKRRSRSLRRRDTRSHSHSWSPKRGRSKSPPSFRTNMSARRGRDQLPECLNFNRGRCFRGASCRFLHRDFRLQPYMPRRYQDPRKHRYLDSSDDASLLSISRNDNAGTPELQAEKSNKLIEARDYEKHVYKEQYDTGIGTAVLKLSDGKDELAPTSETEDAANQVSQEMNGSRELEPPVERILLSLEGESTKLQMESSESKQVDHAIFEQPSSGEAVSFQPSQLTTQVNISEAEKSSEHAHALASSASHPLPVQTSHSANDSIQPLTCQMNVGENIAAEATTGLNSATPTHSQNVTPTKPPVQPLHEESSPHFLTSGANFQPPQPFPPAHILNDNLNGPFSSQHFKENVMPPISYQSQLPQSHMLYPPPPPLPSNFLPNNALQPNLTWSDLNPTTPQNMFTLLSRPPFPSSEPTHMHQPNAMPPRNSFMPSVRPYPSGEIPGSRPSDFYPPSFYSMSSGHPPRPQPFPNEQGMIQVQNQGLNPSSSLPLLRPFQGEEISMPRIRDVHHSHQPSLYNQETHPAAANLPARFGTAGSMNPSIQRYPDNYFQPQPSDAGLPIFPTRERFNPYASIFEHPLRSPGIPGPEIRRFDSALSADNVPIVGIGFGMRPSPSSTRRLAEQFPPKIGSYPHESFAEVTPDSKTQLVREPVAGAPYDPLFDSIEQSSDTSKMRVEEQNSGINDTGSASKLNLHKPAKFGSKKRRRGSVTELKAEVDELGEVATDADAGGVENESPQLLDKDWSPGIHFDEGETNVGEIEINQVRSPSKSKKNRDSRSMRLFKIALADFAKEVLKPSWRQGNLSKEAFKTIVKKTVDKVAGAVPSHHIPKSQVKINQYVDSSQRKLTKLVMGYVDKYVKM
ncbi:hypothetical protein KFK09_004573 [Dendrobium nobile]|uniref:Uncharacterized protein n=1 Tax=Dendrobium nobile TaxID=94219 RepID=A0A8T3C6G5_DENNO|nr:hypothetical protein KFK09_004573 [Dendrobium nobile]